MDAKGEEMSSPEEAAAAAAEELSEISDEEVAAADTNLVAEEEEEQAEPRLQRLNIHDQFGGGTDTREPPAYVRDRRFSARRSVIQRALSLAPTVHPYFDDKNMFMEQQEVCQTRRNSEPSIAQMGSPSFAGGMSSQNQLATTLATTAGQEFNSLQNYKMTQQKSPLRSATMSGSGSVPQQNSQGTAQIAPQNGRSSLTTPLSVVTAQENQGMVRRRTISSSPQSTSPLGPGPTGQLNFQQSFSKLHSQDVLSPQDDYGDDYDDDDDDPPPPPPPDDNDSDNATSTMPFADDEDDVNGSLSHYLHDARFSNRLVRTTLQLPKYALPMAEVLVAANTKLVQRFNVIKANPNQRKLTRKIRVWEIDLLRQTIRNINRTGKIRKTFNISNLLFVAKAGDSPRIVLQFVGSHHPYELVFDESRDREHFYEMLLSMRPYSMNWCPHLSQLLAAQARRQQEAGATEATTPALESLRPCCVTIDSQFDTSRLDESTRGKQRSRSYFRKSTPQGGIVAGQAQVNLGPDDGFESISILCGTWNMASKPPPPSHLDCMGDFLVPDQDLYILSFQECTYKKESDDDESHMGQYVRKYLGQSYATICSLQLWGIKLLVAVKEKHVPKISCVEFQNKATGLFGVLGNKGGIAVAFKFNESRICAVGCHLAAREERVPERIENIQAICEGCRFGYKDLDLDQFDYVFWCGDMNWRLDLPFEEGVELASNSEGKDGAISKQATQMLLENDQLRRIMSYGQIFSGYQEADITFRPSYKFDQGNRVYTLEKSRTPSYCDRVLFKSLPGCNIQVEKYDSPSSITTSDHSPVFAQFKVSTQLRFLSMFCPPEPSRSIVLSSIFVSGRQGDLITKPGVSIYVSFAADIIQPAGTPISGGKQPALANPRIDDRTVPAIRPRISHAAFLERQYIYVAVRDLKVANSKEPSENIIGYGIFPLREAMQAIGTPVRCSVELRKNTTRIGKVNATIKIAELTVADISATNVASQLGEAMSRTYSVFGFLGATQSRAPALDMMDALEQPPLSSSG